MPTRQNRRERQAQARKVRDDSPTGHDIPLSQPSRAPSAARSKTLLQLASERNLLPTSSPSSTFPPEVEAISVQNDGSLSKADFTDPDVVPDSTTPFLDIILYTLSLTLLHLTLTLLVENQYAITPPTLSALPNKILQTSIASTTPYILFLLVSVLHPRASRPETQALFTAMSLGCGSWLVHTTNRDAYLAAMQRAPNLGTLWIWSVVELRWELAAGTVGAVGAWGWWKGYGF